MNPCRFAIVMTCASLGADTSFVQAQESATPPDTLAITYVCPPCGAPCHGEDHDAPGVCAPCGMDLVDASTVTRVGIYVFDGVDLSKFATAAEVFRSSRQALIHTVADTPDEVSASELVTFTPRFSFDDAPDADVLIIVGGANIRDYAGDTLITDWVARAMEAADHVLCVGLGPLFLHPSGALEGKRIPLPQALAGSVDRFLPGAIAETEKTAITHGKIHYARDEAAAVDQALAILAAISHEDIARSTAEGMGYDYSGSPTSTGDEK